VEGEEASVRLDVLPFQALAIKSIAFATSNAASIAKDIANGLRWELNQMKQRGG